MNELLWTPSDERIQQSNITQYIEFLNRERNLDLDNYHTLYEWSVNNIPEFWYSIWEYFNIIHSKEFNEIVTNLEDFPPSTKWFVGSKLNFAENLLRYRDDQRALIFEGEKTDAVEMTYAELYQQVGRLSNSLKEIGFQKGDRAAAYMPNLIETPIAMLSISTLGGTWSSCGSELGADAALDRLGQIEPKIIFSADGYYYKGKKFNLLSKLKEVVVNIGSVEKVVIVPFTEENPDISDIPNSVLLDDFISTDEIDTIDFVQVDFSHPQYIMFSSGTTGKPKCMVQSVGGILINHMKELILHTDLKRDDKLMYLSSPSWMMWNWMISALSVGCTIVLYEGNPLYPNWTKVWELIEKHKVSVFGCSASYLHHLKNIEAQPGKEFNLSSLKQISQTGSVLSNEGFHYVYNEIKDDLHLNSISGGTDINGCFAAGSPTLPVYSGQLQSRALGMKVKSYSNEGDELLNEQGELVCELPSPSMPVYFWKDENNERYEDAYFDYFDKHVWRHGDYVKVHSDTGGISFFGRSDSVLKPSGVRIGTAEIYNIVENMNEVSDSLAIGQNWEDDQRIILFVVPTEGKAVNDDLITNIKTELRERASPRHVPAKIIEAPDVPYTFSGKKVESAITNIIHGKEVKNRGAMSNPECLTFYEEQAKILQKN